jgi:hypothetical protein
MLTSGPNNKVSYGSNGNQDVEKFGNVTAPSIFHDFGIGLSIVGAFNIVFVPIPLGFGGSGGWVITVVGGRPFHLCSQRKIKKEKEE